MKQIITQIQNDLKKIATKENRVSAQKFYKPNENVNFYGVKTPVVRKLASKYSKQLQISDKKFVFQLCENLLKSGINEESTVAFALTYKRKNEFELEDFEIFEKWLKKYIDNWSKCDDFCTHIISYYVYNFPETVEKVKLWKESKNMWVRRASAVSFITTVNNQFGVKHNFNDIFEIAKTLMSDPEDLVQKGYGWMLKAASVVEPKKVYDFVLKNEKKMSRTAFRYSLEKMPKNWKEKAMKKDSR